MPANGNVKSQHLRALNAELRREEESLNRWLTLGKRLRKTSDERWRNVANLRRLNIQTIKHFIKSARSDV
jgi:hypothetical protein